MYVDPDKISDLKGKAGGASGGDAKVMAGDDLVEAEDNAASRSSLYKGKDDSGGIKNQFLSNVKKHKKSVIFGGAGGGLIISLLFLVLSLIPYELRQLESIVVGKEEEVVEHFEQKEANRVASKLIKNQTDNDGDERATDETEAGDQATSDDADSPDEPLRVAFDGLNISALIPSLNAHGFVVSYSASDNLSMSYKGISTTTSLAGETDMPSNIFVDFSNAVPQFDSSQLVIYKPFLTTSDGVSFSFDEGDSDADSSKNELDTNVQQAEFDNVENGASASEEASAPAEEDQSEQSDKYVDSSPGDATYQTGAPEAPESGEEGDIADEVNTIESDVATSVANKVPISEAISNAVDSVTSSLSNAISGIKQAIGLQVIKVICGIKSSVDNASATRVPHIDDLLARHGSLLTTIVSKLMAGKLGGSALSSIMNQINDNVGSDDPTYSIDGQPSKDPTRAAGYRRDDNQSVDSDPTSKGYNPDLSSDAEPSKNSAQLVLSDVEKDLPGSNTVCAAVNNGPISDGVTLLGALGDLTGVGFLIQVGFGVASAALQQIINKTLLPEVLKYFTNFAIDGVEPGVQWINNSDAGLDETFNDYGRRIGAVPLTNTQDQALRNESNQDTASTYARASFTTRVFALSNPDSLTSHLLGDLPIGIGNTMAGVTSFFSNLPGYLFHSFSLLLVPKAAAASTYQDPYGVVQYGFLDSEVGTNAYDPVKNEQYLFSPLNVLNESTGKVVSVSRISMLGDPTGPLNGFNGYNDPNGYVDNVNEDTDFTDLMHCFVDSSGLIMQNGLGNSNNYNPMADQFGPFPSTSVEPDDFCMDIGNISDSYSQTQTAPNDDNIASLYCYYENKTWSPPGSACWNFVRPQLNNEVGHYRQYLLDINIMAGYENLATKSSS